MQRRSHGPICRLPVLFPALVFISTLAGLAPAPSRADPTTSVVVPAVQDLPGVDTGVDVAAGESLRITATGIATYGFDCACGGCGDLLTDPTGLRYVNGAPCAAGFNAAATLATAPIGALLARIGPGPWLYAGTSLSTTPTASGRLFLIYNDVPGEYGNNGGSYMASITLGNGGGQIPPGTSGGTPSAGGGIPGHSKDVSLVKIDEYLVSTSPIGGGPPWNQVEVFQFTNNTDQPITDVNVEGSFWIPSARPAASLLLPHASWTVSEGSQVANNSFDPQLVGETLEQFEVTWEAAGVQRTAFQLMPVGTYRDAGVGP